MTALNGQKTVTTSGTPVQVASNGVAGWYLIKAHPDNTDVVWFGRNGVGAPATNGCALSAGESERIYLNDIADLTIDADVSGEKLTWFYIGRK
jgi:hypothetical protein